MEGGIAGEDGTRRRQNQAEAERAAARAFGKQSRRAAEERKRAAGVAAAAALAQSAANGHLEWEGVTGSKEQQEKVLAAMAVSHAVATGTAGSTKTWSSLAGWWTALSAQRFPGLVCEATGGTCEAVSAGGGACTQPGFRRDGVVACRGCRHAMNGTRAHKGDCRQETRYERRCRSMHCQICGAAGQEGAEETWGGMGRWLMVCGECAGGMKVVPEERRCGVCGTTEAPMIAGKRAVWKGEPDGQWRCGGGGPCRFQERKPGRLWAARAMAMAEIAVPWLGLGGWTADYVRRAAIDVASMACERHQGGFVGNLIPWALWREAAARQWERMEQHTRAGVVRAVTWPECRSIRVGITDRGSTAEENAEGVAPRRRPHEPRPEELAASGGGSAGGRGGGGGGGGGRRWRGARRRGGRRRGDGKRQRPRHGKGRRAERAVEADVRVGRGRTRGGPREPGSGAPAGRAAEIGEARCAPRRGGAGRRRPASGGEEPTRQGGDNAGVAGEADQGCGAEVGRALGDRREGAAASAGREGGRAEVGGWEERRCDSRGASTPGSGCSGRGKVGGGGTSAGRDDGGAEVAGWAERRRGARVGGPPGGGRGERKMVAESAWRRTLSFSLSLSLSPLLSLSLSPFLSLSPSLFTSRDKDDGKGRAGGRLLQGGRGGRAALRHLHGS